MCENTALRSVAAVSAILLLFPVSLRAQQNIARSRPVYAVGFVETNPPLYANDGDSSTTWIHNQPTGWISFDLGSTSSVATIRLLVEQTPAGQTEHVVSVAGADEVYGAVHTFAQHTEAGMWLSHDFSPALIGVRHVKVTKTSGPSWLAWREIEVLGSTAEPEACPACYFGYYWGAGQHPDMDGNYMSEFADHSNIVHIVDDDPQRLAAKLQESAQRGMMAILAPTWQLFSQKAVLRADYEARWQAYADAVAPYTDDILGFYPMDEPLWYDGACHFSAQVRQVYELANSIIKQRFPTKPIIVTFAYPCVTSELVIPAGYDWISFDQYRTFTTIPGYLELIKSKMAQGQKVLLTADGFASGGVPTARDQYGWAVRARQYLNLARADADVLGLWTFLWPSFSSGAGVRVMPLVRDEYQRLGAEILACRPPGEQTCCVRTDCDDDDVTTDDVCNVLTGQCVYSATDAGADAGAEGLDAGATRLDVGATGLDAGVTDAGGGAVDMGFAPDVPSAPSDSGGSAEKSSSNVATAGCACSTGAPGDSSSLILALIGLWSLLRRCGRARPGRPPLVDR